MANDSTALARSEPKASALAGTYDDGNQVTRSLQVAAAHFHLVAPAPACGQVPDGCSVALSVVPISIEHETYSLTGEWKKSPEPTDKLGLSKAALDKIGAAIGISWDPALSRRLDDGSDPYYCAWQAVGSYRHFDGTEVRILGSKEMDLREGSAQVTMLRERYQAALEKHRAGRGGKYPPKDPDQGQIREMRLHIAAHAETKARLRATRAIGIRTSYTREELAKPFVCAKLMFTGRSADPELRKLAFTMRAERMLGATQALYGSPALERAPTQPAPLSAPPPTPRRELDEDDVPALEPAAEPIDVQQPQEAPAKQRRAPRAPAPANGLTDEQRAKLEALEREERAALGEDIEPPDDYGDRADSPEGV